METNKVALIVNLGTRDIRFDQAMMKERIGAELYQEMMMPNQQGRISARNAGRVLLDVFDKVKDLLEFPIVKPAMDLLINKKGRIDLVICVGTDQQKMDNQYYYSDSVHYIELLRRYISIAYSDKKQVLAFEKRLVTSDVSYLDRMYQLWNRIIREHPFTELEEFEHIYFRIQGGIAAINYSLMISGLARFGKKMDFIAVNERTEQANTLKISDQYLDLLEKKRIEAALENYHYPVVLSLDIESKVREWAQLAQARMNFDFQKCQLLLQEFDLDTSSRDQRDDLHLDIQNLLSGKGLLEELYINAWIKYLQGTYVDFIQRFFRIIEELVQRKVLECLGMEETALRDWGTHIKAYLADPANKKLAAFFSQYKHQGKELQPSKPSMAVMRAILEFYQTDFPAFMEFIKKVYPLAQLRNASIGSHAFEPVSKERIAEVLASQDYSIEDVFGYLDAYLRPRSNNPFDQINAAIIRIINKEDHHT
jgi:hypothetical protein